MDIVRETSMVPLKNKMTEIRRNRNGRPVFHNYYNNCDKDEEVWAVYGENTVIFWENDDGLLRGYFYTTDLEEAALLSAAWPKGCVIDYLTKNSGELINFWKNCGMKFLYEMHRMSERGITEKKRQQLTKMYKLTREAYYRPEFVRAATLDDAETLYRKCFEVFDPRVDHLPSREKLRRLIENRWVAVYVKNGELLGFHMFTMEENQKYGYLQWNGGGSEAYFSVVVKTEELYSDWLREHNLAPAKVALPYCWVNVENKKAKRIIELYGKQFDGLYDYVWERE